VNLFDTARRIYLALAENPTAMAKIRNERDSLALSIATDSTAGQTITSATVNGQSFTASGAGGVTVLQRLSLLSIVCQMDDAGSAFPKQSHAYFP